MNVEFWNFQVLEHKVFFTELLSLCEADDANLQKLPCYKSITKLVSLRKSALRALSACHYIPECREKIFQVKRKTFWRETQIARPSLSV